MSKQAEDVTGKKYGRLLTVKRLGRNKSNVLIWLFKCDCGKSVSRTLSNVRYCNNSSCGIDCSLGRKHGEARNGGTPTYITWMNMHARCRNAKNKRYGGRGIKVCKRWSTYVNFLEDMGKRPKGKSIDRIDNDGNYSPTNCRWADSKTQGLNRKTTNYFEKDGSIFTLEEISKVAALPYSTIVARHSRGWSLEKMMSKKRFNTNGKEIINE